MGLVDFSVSDIGQAFKDLRAAITGKEVLDPNKQIELLQKANELEARFVEAQARVLEAEAKSEHWLTSAWRPITMLVFVAIIANNYILAPYMQAFGLHVPTLELSAQMWELLKIGLGGYILGRSAEKVVREWKKG